MDKQMLCLHTIYYYSAIQRKEVMMQYAKWKKPDTEVCIIYDSICMTYSE